MNGSPADGERRQRIVFRALPLVVLALAAFAVGLLAGRGASLDAVERFLAAWERGDTAAMHAELSPRARAEYPEASFEARYAEAAETATIAGVDVAEPELDGDAARAEVTVTTRIFGTLGGELRLPLAEELVDWQPHLVFPELEPGQALGRRTRAPRRAPILAADGAPLAEGPASARSVPLEGAPSVVGSVGEPEAEQARELAARGFPEGTLAGSTGLELAYEHVLAGSAGGELVALASGTEDPLDAASDAEVLATSEPEPGRPLRTTIDPELQAATVAALGDRFGGIAVLDARNGAVLALAGVAYSAPQPPGSTFKVVTATGALDAGIVELSDRFPVETANSDIGREIENSNDSPCGGTFAEAFANSCNTVFAPLGAELGGRRLVATAERFGWNSPPPLFDPPGMSAVAPPASTIPAEIESSVAAGESAIGQGQVLATPLQMASVAQAIAAGGVRSPTPIVRRPELGPTADPARVTSPETARILTELMIGVVADGTGTAAALPGVQVAGKTGTAELGPKPLEPGVKLAPGEDPPQEKDAWFMAFAPAERPSLAVAVMIVNAEGDGGEIAAPIAREVLAAGLGL